MLVSNTYARYYHGISAYGEGKVTVDDIKYHSKEDFQKNNEPVSFIIHSGVTEIEKGVFDIFLPLKEIIVSDTVKSIGVSSETLDIFRNNDVIIRGKFDSYAEQFAEKYNLWFMHSDIEIARVGDYYEHGVDIITLCFNPSGKPYIHEDSRCQGISAGSTGGGESSVDLPDNFYKTHSTTDIADLCWGSCYRSIKNSKDLQEFLTTAKARDGYRFKY